MCECVSLPCQCNVVSCQITFCVPFSSILVSATNKVYQSLARLIKLCDEVLLQGEKALDNENDVCEVIQLLEGAVQVRVVAADRVLTMWQNVTGLVRHDILQ